MRAHTPNKSKVGSHRQPLPKSAMSSELLLHVDSAQRLGRGDNRDILIRAENEQIAIAEDDEIGLSGERAREHVIVVRIATGWCWRRLRFDEVG